MKRKILSLILSICMAASLLVGCSTGEESGTSNSSDEITSDSTTSETNNDIGSEANDSSLDSSSVESTNTSGSSCANMDPSTDSSTDASYENAETDAYFEDEIIEITDRADLSDEQSDMSYYILWGMLEMAWENSNAGEETVYDIEDADYVWDAIFYTAGKKGYSLAMDGTISYSDDGMYFVFPKDILDNFAVAITGKTCDELPAVPDGVGGGAYPVVIDYGDGTYGILMTDSAEEMSYELVTWEIDPAYDDFVDIKGISYDDYFTFPYGATFHLADNPDSDAMFDYIVTSMVIYDL